MRVCVCIAMVSAMDEAIGNITEALMQRGMWENTLLVFTTDVRQPIDKNITCNHDYANLDKKNYY